METFARELIELLKEETGCDIQHNGCCCRTCFYDLCEGLGLTNERATEFWRIILILRGDYTEEEIKSYEKGEEKERIKKKHRRN